MRLTAPERVAERMQRTRVGIGQLREQVEHALAQCDSGAVEQADGPRDTAFGRGGSLLHLRIVGFTAGGGRDRQRHVGGLERAQQQSAAARAKGWQFAAGCVVHKQQQGARRRFLQHLQQGIGTGRVEFVDRIDDGDAPPALAGGRAEERDAAPGVFDANFGE